eukprot:6198975-Karenia_brevis.AAC.1
MPIGLQNFVRGLFTELFTYGDVQGVTVFLYTMNAGVGQGCPLSGGLALSEHVLMTLQLLFTASLA